MTACAVCGNEAVKPALFRAWLCKAHRYACASAWAAWISSVQRFHYADDVEYVAAWVEKQREGQGE